MELLQEKFHVAEYQGLYGAIRVPEIVIQKIWYGGHFSKHQLRTQSGKPLKLLNLGRWNKQEGPDFIEARVEIDGKQIAGDVEIHLYREAWYQHKHHLAERFSNVILHVYAFPPRQNNENTLNKYGKSIEELLLLPYLENDLESYEHEQALLGAMPKQNLLMSEHWKAKPIRETQQQLLDNARKRYLQKVSFARIRIEQYGWMSANHQYALEVLGARRNRSAMSNIALHNSLSDFELKSIDELYAQQEKQWLLKGLRPANHPRRRLQQYKNLVLQNKQWPLACARLHEILLASIDDRTLITSEYRKRVKLRQIVEHIEHSVIYQQIGGCRLHTWCIDAMLPLLAAYHNCNLFWYWFHWYCGDLPAQIIETQRSLKAMQIIKSASNGAAQGIMQLLINVNRCVI